MESQNPQLNFRRKKSFNHPSGLPNYAIRLLEKRDTLDSISVCSTTSCSSGYLSDTNTSFDDAEDWDTEMHSKVARAVRDLEIKSWRRRMANKRRMERRGSFKTPSLPSIVITETTEDEATAAEDPEQWIEWGELGLLQPRLEVSASSQTITSVPDSEFDKTENTLVQSTQPPLNDESYNLKDKEKSVITEQHRFPEREHTEVFSIEHEQYGDLETYEEKSNSKLPAEGCDDFVQANNNNRQSIQMCTSVASENGPSPYPEGKTYPINNSAADDLDNIFDELIRFSDGYKGFDCDKIQRTSTPECQRESSFLEEIPTSNIAAAFEELLQIDEKYQHKGRFKLKDRSPSTDHKTEGIVQASVQRIEENTAKTILQNYRWRGEGYQTSEVRMTSDTGHLVWIKPRGTLDVVIGKGDKTKAFRCYIDPQNSGMKLCHLNKDGLLEVVLDGREGPTCSRSEHKISKQIGMQENYFRLESCDGHVRLLLDPLVDSKWDFFKMNYVIV